MPPETVVFDAVAKTSKALFVALSHTSKIVIVPPLQSKILVVLSIPKLPYPVVILVAERAVFKPDVVVTSVRLAKVVVPDALCCKRPLKINVPPDWLYKAELVPAIKQVNCLVSTVPPLINSWPAATLLVKIPPDSRVERYPLLTVKVPNTCIELP